jgi:hypothetical protein
MIELTFKTNIKGFTAYVNKVAAEHEKAVVRALNKTAISARAEASREVKALGYNIKSSAIKDSFSIKKATLKNLEVVLVSTGRKITLINYGAIASKMGVSVKIKGKRTVLRHAFIATMSNGHIGVYERVGLARTGAKAIGMNGRLRRVNLPIRELYGPSIPEALSQPIVEQAIMRNIQEQFPKILKAEINFLNLKR